MEKDYLYEYSANALRENLLQVSTNVSEAYKVLGREPMFCVANKNLRILKGVEAFAGRAVTNVVIDLLIHILKDNGIRLESRNTDITDFCICNDTQCVGYIVTEKEEWVVNVEELKAAGIDKLVFIVLEEKKSADVLFFEPTSGRFLDSGCKGYVNNVLLQDFLEGLGINEFETFKEFAQIYSNMAENIVGINTAIVPTEKALDECKKAIKEEFFKEDYLKEIAGNFSEDEIKRVRKFTRKNIDVLIGTDEFAKSFLSSEWYYNLQTKTDRGLEQTAIVAGYLKSVEQFICSLIIAHANRKRKIYVEHKRYVDSEGRKKMYPFDVNYKKDYNLTLGALNSYMKEPRNRFFIRYDEMQEKIVKFLEKYCMHTRNGYLHKDNIYTWLEINEIRNQTYCVYFLLLGYLFMNDSMKVSLEKQVILPEVEEKDGMEYAKFSEWLTGLMQYDDDIGFNVIYFKLQPNKYTKFHRLEIMGMDAYGKGEFLFDVNDSRTIPEIIRMFMYTPFEWKSSAEGEELREEAAKVIERYLLEGEYAEALKKYQAVLVGNFNDADIVYIRT